MYFCCSFVLATAKANVPIVDQIKDYLIWNDVFCFAFYSINSIQKGHTVYIHMHFLYFFYLNNRFFLYLKTSKKKNMFMSFNINKIHYTSVELFKFKSLSMHLNKIHVYTVSFRQGNKQCGSNVTRPFLKSWIDGEAVVAGSAGLFLTSDSTYCHFYFLHNLKLIFKTFPVSARPRPRPSWVRSRMQATSLLCCSAWFLFSFLKKQRFGVLFFFCTITLMQNSALGKTYYFTVTLQIRFSNTDYSSFNWSWSLLINTKPEIVFFHVVSAIMRRPLNCVSEF